MQTISKLVVLSEWCWFTVQPSVMNVTSNSMDVVSVCEKLSWKIWPKFSFRFEEVSKLQQTMLPLGPWTKALPSWWISSWSLLLFRNALDFPWQTNPTQHSISRTKMTNNHPMRQTYLAKLLVRRPQDLPDLLRRPCWDMHSWNGKNWDFV